MSDAINLDAGDAAENVIAGQKNRQTTQRVDPNQNVSQRAGDVYYGGGNSELMQIWLKLSEHTRDIQDLIRRLDNLPERVRDLEKTEVVIRPRPVDGPEVIIRAAQPANLSARSLMIVLVSALAIVVALVAFLVYWQIAHAV